MLLSAAFMLVLGLVTTFAPSELLASNGGRPGITSTLLVQAVGGLYLGFAILNWMAKDNLIGGIYSRPVALGNFLHFFTVAMALIKANAVGQRSATLLILTFCYAVFAVWFGLVLFTHPPRTRAPDAA